MPIKGRESGDREDRISQSPGQDWRIEEIAFGNQSHIRWNPVDRWIELGISQVMRQIKALGILSAASIDQPDKS